GVQADIANLVGQVLTIAHKCQWQHGRSLPPSYIPLVRGASSYNSVFGYWIGSGKAARRVDDRTEVVEFVIRPTELGAVTALVLAEVVFPALFYTRQDEALVIVRHSGQQYQVSVARTSPRHTTSPRGASRSEKLTPSDFIEYLIELCLYGWQN